MKDLHYKHIVYYKINYTMKKLFLYLYFLLFSVNSLMAQDTTVPLKWTNRSLN